MGPRTQALADPYRFSRFVSVGILGTVIDLGIASILLLTTGIPPELVKVIGAECAIVVMFVVNDRWTFTRHQTTRFVEGVARLLKSNLVRSGGIAVQVVVVYVLLRTSITVVVFGVDAWPVLAMAIAIACAGVLNYVGETLLTWGVRG